MGANGKIQWFGTINPRTGTGTTGANWPDSNNIGIAKRRATGHEFPWNMMRDDSWKNTWESDWAAGAAKGQQYCKDNGVALMFQFYYPHYMSGETKNSLENLARQVAPYCEGYPVYVILVNECLTGNISAPIGGINNSPFSDYGGAGSTGIDGFINFTKAMRGIFPSNCKLGINEYNAADFSTGNWSTMDCAIKVHQICKDNGATLDYFGAEGYWFSTNYYGYNDPVAMINALCNKFGQAIGIPIIYSECSMDCPTKGIRYYKKQIDLYKAILPAMAANPWCEGWTGPWGGYRASTIWNGSSGENCKELCWLYNDDGSAHTDPDTGASVGSGAVTETLTWLQSWAPDNVIGEGGTPPPDGGGTPQPESADGTVVKNDSSGQIVDSHSDLWTCTGGKVQKNSALAGYTSNVVQIEYHNHVVWQTNASGGWWKWTGSDWAAGTNPNPNPPDAGNLPSGIYTVPAGTKIMVP